MVLVRWSRHLISQVQNVNGSCTKEGALDGPFTGGHNRANKTNHRGFRVGAVATRPGEEPLFPEIIGTGFIADMEHELKEALTHLAKADGSGSFPAN